MAFGEEIISLGQDTIALGSNGINAGNYSILLSSSGEKTSR
jgi:hypothetical protein